jgi:MFS family permease
MAADLARTPTVGWRDLVAEGRLPRFALVCAGTWLAAADELVTATVMPSAARDIGGYSAFGWAVAIFLLGSILGGATAGRLASRLGLRRAMAVAGAVYAVGCAASACAPDMDFFLAGRLAQGLGGGSVVGLSYVATTSLFPEALWPRVLSGLSGVWGVATLFGPLIGGIFAQAGFWRGAFWIFAAQGVGFIAATAALVPRGAGAGAAGQARLPLVQILVLAASVGAIGAAGLLPTPAEKVASALTGLALLGAFLRLDSRAPASLLPRDTGRVGSAASAGLFMIFALNAGGASFAVYGSALMQKLYGVAPIVAGYVLGAGAMGWTLAAVAVAGRRFARGSIRLGVAMIALSQATMMVAVPHGSIPLIAALVFTSGAGFGLLWAFAAARIVANTVEAERALASGAVPTASMIGAAVAAAAAGSIATGLGVGRGMSLEEARAAGFWLFAAFTPLTLAACLSAWRLTSSRFADPT